MQVSSSCFDDSVHELNENTTDTVGDSSLGKRKRKHVDMNDSCHVVSRYTNFVKPFLLPISTHMHTQTRISVYIHINISVKLIFFLYLFVLNLLSRI